MLMIEEDKQGFEKCLEKTNQGIEDNIKSSWLNCVLRGDEAVYWVSIAQQLSVPGGTEYRFILDGTGSLQGLYAIIH